MRADLLTTFGRIMQFIDHGFEPNELAKVVEFALCKSLPRKEQDSFFQSRIIRPINPREVGSFKVRWGKVGDYCDYFTAERIDYIEPLPETGRTPSSNTTEAFGVHPGKPGAQESLRAQAAQRLARSAA